jgi:HEAT repeat protein
MEAGIKELARRVVESSSDKDISEEHRKLINSLNSDLIVRELKKLYYREKTYSITKSRAYSALKCVENIDILSLVEDIFDKSPVDWRAFLCQELALHPSPRGITKLIDVLLNDKNANVRYSAAEALGDIGNAEALQALEHAVKNDKGKDFEGLPVAREAQRAIQNIRNRSRG